MISEASFWLPFAIKTSVTVLAFFLFRRLLAESFSAATVSAAIGTSIAIGLLWLIDVGNAAKIEFFGVEFDRSIEAAEQIYARLEPLEAAASDTVENLREVDANAKKTAEQLRASLNQQHAIFAIEALENRARGGDRSAFLALAEYSDVDPLLKEHALSGVFAVKTFYVGSTKVGGIRLLTRDESGNLQSTEDSEVSAQTALGLLNHPEWRTRAVAARALRSRRHNGVPDALLILMETDPNLAVASEAMKSFKAITGYKTRDVFDFLNERPRIWYEKNREEVAGRLEALPYE